MMKKENSIWDLYISGIIICLGGLFLLFPLIQIVAAQVNAPLQQYNHATSIIRR